MNARDNKAMQALSDAGAVCGNCGDEPGDRTCPDCERWYQQYADALRAAGWAPRTEVLAEAIDALHLVAAVAATAGGQARWAIPAIGVVQQLTKTGGAS
jgi:hypothetical protein